MVWYCTILQSALATNHIVQILVYLHRIFAVVEAPAEAGGGRESVHSALDTDTRPNIGPKRLLLTLDTPGDIWNTVKCWIITFKLSILE